MRILYLVAIVLTLFSRPLAAAQKGLLLVSVRAEVGVQYIDRVKLEVNILGVYGPKGIRPGILIGLTETHACPPDQEDCGRSTSYSHTYDRVDSLIATLIEAKGHIARKTPFRRAINMAEIPCRPNDDFKGTIVVNPTGGSAQFALGSGGAVNLNKAELTRFLSHLQQARDVLAHLRPRFDAFNAASPDNSIIVSPDKLDYYWPPGSLGEQPTHISRHHDGQIPTCLR